MAAETTSVMASKEDHLKDTLNRTIVTVRDCLIEYLHQDKYCGAERIGKALRELIGLQSLTNVPNMPSGGYKPMEKIVGSL